MAVEAILGFDVGTSSSKGVLVDATGRVVASATREHRVDRPAPGHVEMDPAIWWREFVDIAGELTAATDAVVTAIGLSGMGPCVLVTDADGVPLRPAILYGVDTRATEQIRRLTDELGGADAIRERCGSSLTSQAVGPKLAWIAEHEPEVWRRARRMHQPASWLAFRLTGVSALDRHSASQCTPLFDTRALDWHEPWVRRIAPRFDLPELHWSDEIVGTTTAEVAGIPSGTPVAIGTIDAWAEAVSAGAHEVGDLMLMYGTTMFLVATVDSPLTSPALWGTVGAVAGTRSLAGGMATSGAITSWLRDLTGGADYADLLAEADASGPGARGVLVLPYFAGERTPIHDPDARGVIAGLELRHTRGDLYRAALEATGYAVRHNIDVLSEAGARIERVVAVGGGTRGGLWTRIVSDITGMPQSVPTVTIGASYGAAFLAARATSAEPPDIRVWNPTAAVVEPDPAHRARYDDGYALYRELGTAMQDISHALAARSKEDSP